MATRKQIAAKRRNAKKSTGPKTPAGRAVSRFNALRHGLRSQIESSPAENWQDLLEIRERFLQEWQPQTPDQRRLVARVACAEWRLLQWHENRERLLRGVAETSSPGRFSARQARLERDLRDAYDKLTKCMPLDSPESRPAA